MNISFDIESIFHLQGNIGDYSPHEVLDYVLLTLKNANKFATFYVVADYAEVYPEIIVKIVRAGHKIGSHSKTHRRLCDLDWNDIEYELVESKRILEKLSMGCINSFRAPEFAVPNDLSRYFNLLLQTGYAVDSSCITGAFELKIEEVNPCLIIEQITPIARFSNKHILCGGRFSRYIPYFVLAKFCRRYSYVYFHLHDLDKNVKPNYLKSLQKSWLSIATASNSRKLFENVVY